MSIYQKVENGTWYFSLYVPGRKLRLRGSCGTRDRAEALIVEQTLRLASTGRSPKAHLIGIIEALYGDDKKKSPDIPLGVVARECARIASNAGKPPSERLRKRNGATMVRLARWAADFRPDISGVRGIDRRAAHAFAAALIKDGVVDSTRAKVLGELSAMWNVLRREHDGLENPWPLAMPMHVEKRRRNAFSAEEARRVFAAADEYGHGWGLASRIAAATGLRYGDIASLRYGDIRDGAIRLRPNKTADFGIEVVLPLPQSLLDFIGPGESQSFLLPEHASGYGRGWVGKHPFSDVLRLAGLDPADGYTFHSWRHYFRTQLARAGVRDDVAMRLGGWTQRDTAARYDHDDHRDELANAIKGAWALTEGN